MGGAELRGAALRCCSALCGGALCGGCCSGSPPRNLARPVLPQFSQRAYLKVDLVTFGRSAGGEASEMADVPCCLQAVELFMLIRVGIQLILFCFQLYLKIFL